MSDATAMACNHLLSLLDASAIADTPEAAEMRRQVDAIVRDNRDSQSAIAANREYLAWRDTLIRELRDENRRQHELLCHVRHAMRDADALLAAYPPRHPKAAPNE